MTHSVDKGIDDCPPPDHLGKFAKFIWMCHTSIASWHLEDLIELQTALEYWEDFRLARSEGRADRMQVAARQFAEIWPSFEPRDNASRLAYPDCLTTARSSVTPTLWRRCWATLHSEKPGFTWHQIGP